MSRSPVVARTPTVVVDLEPELLADLLRRMLVDRGVTITEPGAPRQHVTAALVGPSSRVAVDADFTVRLLQSGERLPAEVEVKAGEAEADTPRLVTIATPEDLIDLLMSLIDE